MRRLSDCLNNKELLWVPLVFDPLSARIAETSGFKVLYVGGAALGYVKCVTEANLGLLELVQSGLDIRSVTKAHLILDGAGGFGDPMHLHRTIKVAEAAGFSAIEIEDQVLPKRAHHHVGIEHNVPTSLMVEKIHAAVSARASQDFLIIARTNAARNDSLDEAVRRGEAYRRAGADMLLILQKSPDQAEFIGRRLGPSLVYMAIGESLSSIRNRRDELIELGFRMVIDPSTPLLASYQAMKIAYTEMANFQPHLSLTASGGPSEILNAIHETMDLDTLLRIEKRTVEP
jgi:2-methylisocitrate lyase-like PEP mutase family enzyme